MLSNADIPPLVRAEIEAYDPPTGCYRRADGSLDSCPTEIPTLSMWYDFVVCNKPATIVETGVYQGLSTCFLAMALKAVGGAGARIHAIDPWPIDKLWAGSDLEPYISYMQMGSQDAAPTILELDIDLLIIDSIHTYDQSSWELETFEPRVREGGYIIMHDSLFFDGVGRTARHLYESDRFEVTTFDTPRTQEAPNVTRGRLPMGCTIARKVKNGPPIARDPEWFGVPEQTPMGPDAYIRNFLVAGRPGSSGARGPGDTGRFA